MRAGNFFLGILPLLVIMSVFYFEVTQEALHSLIVCGSG
jgi:preprotein translocase subunit YajC